MNINPVRMGTGINIKLLEAMAYGMPCVTTVTGARGLERFARNALWVLGDEDYSGLAQAVSALITSTPLRERYGNAAKAAALKWNASQKANLQTLLTLTPSMDTPLFSDVVAVLPEWEQETLASAENHSAPDVAPAR